ncbi:MAG: tRNA (adenosine(37)-N6)-threonylcarbamoyltransferase complex dimerization subunit type 1 TsaB [Planctomycetota bacterium]|nr:MAG: tRNA (adenosine(37)-N6)-threonylcarbamoyltransferase complex dimerization subunit type 1 TsaB [Planctomycetota bacterium]REJ92352.1 MAG: tRNA (adenosine(37)-N6)-threonylcarbamoyltransferase complex dimerization subunit type 1 TsaB [Planctomycetota bacterium]REK24377.1 MAG: tRNA (adenosine(37)-N6)-threonylcarbamoyltransferase complex dimerization subunit type 1 TsaB [Planctomycetota bacterium]REK38568.1 MAG: tRNA (adenosine(37)-N6)-threonylcarbamoyltransferase complex dimerization subunit
MLTLGIETSDRTGSVALLRDGALLGQTLLSQTGRRHARTLVVELRDLLRGQDLSPAEVETVAVSVGPGSFTGLRVGVVCAKTFAYAVNCAIVAVDTFEAVAAAASPDVNDLDVIGDAQRGDLYVGRYQRGSSGEWRSSGPMEVVALKSWLSTLTGERIVSGPAAAAHAEEIERRSRLLPEALRHPRAEFVARIGERRASAGEADDLWTLVPRYIRRSAAEEKAAARDEQHNSG